MVRIHSRLVMQMGGWSERLAPRIVRRCALVLLGCALACGRSALDDSLYQDVVATAGTRGLDEPRPSAGRASGGSSHAGATGVGGTAAGGSGGVATAGHGGIGGTVPIGIGGVPGGTGGALGGAGGAAPEPEVERLVLFGGWRYSGERFDDTWTFDGDAWSRLAVDGPPATRSPALAPLGSRLVLYTGVATEEFWSFDDDGWTSLDSVTAPPPGRDLGELASLGDKVVLFGGLSPLGSYVGDTWTFDGARWQEASGRGPTPRAGHALARIGNQIVLYGGYDGDHWLSDTWLFDGIVWTHVTDDGPGPRTTMALASWHGQVVLFGGYDGDERTPTPGCSTAKSGAPRTPPDRARASVPRWPSSRVTSSCSAAPLASRCSTIRGASTVLAGRGSTSAALRLARSPLLPRCGPPRQIEPDLTVGAVRLRCRA